MSFTIKELESLTGIKAHTIRIWEQRYNFLKPSRTETNIRTYNNEELKTLLTVALLNKYGYKISHIDGMPAELRNQEVLGMPLSDAQNEHAVNLLIGYMIDLEVHPFEALLNRHILQKGLSDTLQTIIFSFLEKIGVLWQTNRINPAHEHIVSNIIRQKIIAAIENLPAVYSKPSFLLFLPEGEYHELGLLYVYFLLKSRGLSVLYLGANVPIKDVGYVYEIVKPQYLYLHLISFPTQLSFQKYVSALSAKAPAATILLSGSMAQFCKKEVPSNLVLLKSFSAVTTYISGI